MTVETVTTGRMLAVAETPAWTIDRWVQRGYLRPIGEGGIGRRAYLRWPLAEVHIAVLMKRLIAVGFEAGAAAIYARQVEDPTVAHTVILGRGITLTITDGAS